MIEIGRRRRHRALTPHVVFEALTHPESKPGGSWLVLRHDETSPGLIVADRRGWVVWSSIWLERRDAVIRFDLSPGDGRGTDLEWTVTLEDGVPSHALTAHLLARLDAIVDSDLTSTPPPPVEHLPGRNVAADGTRRPGRGPALVPVR